MFDSIDFVYILTVCFLYSFVYFITKYPFIKSRRCDVFHYICYLVSAAMVFLIASCVTRNADTTLMRFWVVGVLSIFISTILLFIKLVVPQGKLFKNIYLSILMFIIMGLICIMKMLP